MFGPYYHHTDFWWVGGLFALLIVVALVIGVILVVRQVLERPHVLPGPPPMPPAPPNRAVEELDMRYARGEIDRNEYMQRRNDLVHGPTSPPPAPPPQPPSSAPPA